MFHPIHRSELFIEKCLVGLQVWNHHSHQIVKVTSHQVAFHYFRPFQYLLGKAIQIFLDLMMQCYLHKHRDRKAGSLGIN